MKTLEIYDIEVSPNLFTCCIKEYKKPEIDVYEISERKNDILKIKKRFKRDFYLVGFNSVHYDDLIMLYILNTNRIDNEQLTNEIFKLSTSIVNDIFDDYKKYKWMKKPYTTIDLFTYWSKMLRLSKKISLKGLAVQLYHDNIQELPYDPNTRIPLDKIDEVISYNKNDVVVTEKLLDRMKEDVRLRIKIQSTYGIDCLSSDGVKIGLNILARYYEKETGMSFETFKNLKTHRSSVKLSDIILPVISFKEKEVVIWENNGTTYCKNFFSLLEYLKSRTVQNTKDLDCSVVYGGVKHDIKSGGIHSYHNPIIYERLPGYKIIDSDVSSMYPALAIEWNFKPEHLSEKYTTVYRGIRDDRLVAKKNKDKLTAETLKLSVNGTYGNYNNSYSWVYDWKVTLQTTINGQLFLCMLSEQCTDMGIKVLMLNTK